MANLTDAGDHRWTGAPGAMTSSTSFSMTEPPGSAMNVSNMTLTTMSTSGLFMEVTGNFGARNASWTTTSRFQDGEDGVIVTQSMTTSTVTTSLSLTSTNSWTTTETSSTWWPKSTTSKTTTGTQSMTTSTVTTSLSLTSTNSWTTTETSSTWWPRSTTSKTTTGTDSTTTITTTATTTRTSFGHPEFEFHASGPLQTMPNCYLAPLVEKPGCRRVSVEEGHHFGLNELGQETTARRHCLERARDQGNTWVFRVGRCEVWNCSSKEALWRSADSGPPFGGSLAEELHLESWAIESCRY
eukprot:symbB.v1.2.006107.t1/scaffold364.1/size219240/4